MKIKKDDELLLLKINTPDNIDFYNEHAKIINNNGFVWLCKFGKTNLLVSKICDSNIIFLKDTKKNNDAVYIIKFDDVVSEDPKKDYPNYYNDVDIIKSLWFKVKSIYKYDYNELLNNFLTASSNSSLDGVFRSMCNSFYIKANKNIELKEDN